MNIEAIIDKVGRTLSQNSSVLLTGTAVAGTITTAIFSGKGAVQAHEAISGHRIVHNGVAEELTPREQLELTWKYYIPAAISGTTTIACIVGIHSVNTRKQAALISAYSVVDKAFLDYREKVVETLGDRKELEVREEVAKEAIQANPPAGQVIVTSSGGQQLCYESITGRYFRSDAEKIRRAQNDLNYHINHHMYASLNDFFDLLDLPRATIGDTLGWDTGRKLEITFSSHLSEDGAPCLSIDYDHMPLANYYKVN